MIDIEIYYSLFTTLFVSINKFINVDHGKKLLNMRKCCCKSHILVINKQ